MSQWFMENSGGNVVIQKTDAPAKCFIQEKVIYSSSKAEFRLHFNDHFKTVGYSLKYEDSKKYPEFLSFNCFGVVYKDMDEVKTKQPTLEIIYEDQVVRLLAFKHNKNVKDYLLVGRWRTEANRAESEDAE